MRPGVSDGVAAERGSSAPENERAQVVAIQRARILSGAVRAIDELGYAETSVSDIVARSGVSRRTFYETCANREGCLAAVLADAVARVQRELDRAELGRLAWRERVRLGLWTILAFFDREPALARVCVIAALGAGRTVHALREEVLGRLAAVVDEGRLENGRGSECTRVTAEGLVGAVCAILHTRLARADADVDALPMTGLLGELMGMIVLPYLGPAAARRERARPAPPGSPRPSSGHPAGPASAGDLLEGVRMRLTYRTARALEGVLEQPGASNRQIADHAGIGDAGQVSKLLRRLERLGLLENRGVGHSQGEPNEWWLSARGALVAENIRMHAPRSWEAA